MPIPLISEITPQNSGKFALIDDAYVRGGFHCVANLSERNLIPQDRLKVGMRVAVQSTDLVYELQSDLLTWAVDKSLTKSLQDAYNNGSVISTDDGRPLMLNGPDGVSRIFTINDSSLSKILSVDTDGTVEFDKKIRGRDYTSNLNYNVATNQNDVIIDKTDKSKYRAVHYFYTVSNSDNSGYETGQLYLIHDGFTATMYMIQGATSNNPTGISFNASISGTDLQLIASTDNSGSFSRIVHLFKVALI